LPRHPRDSSKAQIGVDIRQAAPGQAQVAQSQASLKQLERTVSYTPSLLPWTGVSSPDVEIATRSGSISSWLTATLVMTRATLTKVLCAGKVDEADIAHVYLGQPARIKVESFRTLSLHQSDKISAMGVEKDNVTLEGARLHQQPQGELKALMDRQRRNPARRAPKASDRFRKRVVYEHQKTLRLKFPQEAKRRQRKVDVKVGLSNGSVTEIVSGLKKRPVVCSSKTVLVSVKQRTARNCPSPHIDVRNRTTRLQKNRIPSPTKISWS